MAGVKGRSGVYKHKSRSLKTRNKISQKMKGVKKTKEHSKNIGLGLIGNKNCLGRKNGLGYKHTRRAKKKISIASMGNKYSLGFKHTKETRRKMSLAKFTRGGISFKKCYCLDCNKRISGYLAKRCRNCAHGGKNNHFWQGGISGKPYVWNWYIVRNKIRRRDNNICQLCDKRKYGKAISVHHIDYNKKNCREGNLISLCRGCNSKINNDRDYWYAYFKYIMEEKYGYD